MGLAGSMASAGLAPLLIWLVERGYVDVLVSTSANATEDLLEARGTLSHQVDPDHVDDRELWQQGFYRFYDHVVSAREYDRMEDFTSEFFEHLAKTWPSPTIAGVHFTTSWGAGWTPAGSRLARRHVLPPRRAAFRARRARRAARRGLSHGRPQGPERGLLRDYEIALDIMSRYMPPGPGIGGHLARGECPTDFIQIIATSVAAQRGNGQGQPPRGGHPDHDRQHRLRGPGGAGVHTECISWGKEAAEGRNVMVFTDLTIALPLLCQGPRRDLRLGSRTPRPRGHRRRSCAGPLAGSARRVLTHEATSRDPRLSNQGGLFFQE